MFLSVTMRMPVTMRMRMAMVHGHSLKTAWQRDSRRQRSVTLCLEQLSAIGAASVQRVPSQRLHPTLYPTPGQRSCPGMDDATGRFCLL
mmetsp:Transcript_36723/g.82614  ORF Transcript_36723/g.82614 Transcript_36723/m.82614 type:complete len:89 (-) Transcript_36723:25-291(-)